MSKDFNKGDKVTVVGNWDSKGTVSYRQAVVLSCGAKQMTLAHEETNQVLGRRFSPSVGTLESATELFLLSTFPRMSDNEAEEFCLNVAKNIIEKQKTEFNRKIEQNKDNATYVNSIRKDLEALHEPRVMKI